MRIFQYSRKKAGILQVADMAGLQSGPMHWIGYGSATPPLAHAAGEGPGGGGCPLQADPGRLELRVLLQRVQRLVAAVAALLVAAERDGDVVLVVGVDVHGAGAQAAGNAVGCLLYTSPSPRD